VIIHLLEFQVVPGHAVEVTGFLRHSLADDPLPAGVVMRCAGRRLEHNQSEHIVATCWRDDDALASGTDQNGLPSYMASKAEFLGSPRSTTYGAAASIGGGIEGGRIIRVYHALIDADAVTEWKQRWREQVDSVAGRDGLICVRAGVSCSGPQSGGELSVVAVSAWRDWDAVLAATSGHIDRLVEDTASSDLERSAELDHYQLIGPDAE